MLKWFKKASTEQPQEKNKRGTTQTMQRGTTPHTKHDKTRNNTTRQVTARATQGPKQQHGTAEPLAERHSPATQGSTRNQTQTKGQGGGGQQAATTANERPTNAQKQKRRERTRENERQGKDHNATQTRRGWGQQ